MSDNEESESQVQLLSVSVAGPIAPFWKDIPKLWFSQFEAVLNGQRASKETKYDLVISKLGRDELTLISDLLDDPRRDYDALKNRLLGCLTASAEEQFDRLLQESQLGEQKPSQLYRRMAECAKAAGVEAATIKKLWLRKLPACVRNALVAHENLGIEELSNLADKVLQTSRQCAIEEVGTSRDDQRNLEQELKSMTQRFEQLCDEVSSIRGRQGTSQQFNRGNGHNYQSRNNQPPRPRYMCIYHQRFGRFARNCQQPCSWQNRQPSQPAVARQQGDAAWRSRQGN